jgi:hypothetical protein
VVYAELPGAQHAFDLFHSLRFEAVVDAIEAFAAWVRSTPVGRGGGAAGLARRAEDALDVVTRDVVDASGLTRGGPPRRCGGV